MFIYFFDREELKNIKRTNNAKDIDWSKVAKSVNLETITKPSPIKIDVSEILLKAKSAQVSPLVVTQTIGPQNGK